MAKYLIKRVETYRVDSEEEAKNFIERNKKANGYTLTKYSSEHKEKKAKGEIVDSWTRVTLTKTFNEEAEPVDEFIEDIDNED